MFSVTDDAANCKTCYLHLVIYQNIYNATEIVQNTKITFKVIISNLLKCRMGGHEKRQHNVS